jgi:hypothetical protein
MMFTIYEKAKQVIAWLGVPTPEDDLFFAIVQDLDPSIKTFSEHQIRFPAVQELDRSHETGDSVEQPYHSNSPIENLDSPTAIQLDSFYGYDEPFVGSCAASHAGQDHEDLYKSARALLHSKTIFQRTWIRQEFMAACELTILCGKHTCSFQEFSNALGHLLNCHNPVDNQPHIDISFIDPAM